ncbi:ABC transporter substrate-binding protein [Enterococcus timonensis]|uniref:ABC transporter substrate-binding protein n=1 Tax=Enterococcus timonensis TaxID=1852364 RepID=UPI0008D9E1CF|nr:extracellular solute-binding protein [Enterococcus timonensis]
MSWKKRILAGVSLSLVSIGLVACGGNEKEGSSADTETDSSSTVIDADHSKGAMEDYAVGKTFKASEPLDVSIMYSDHEAYPYKEDWLFNTELTKLTNITLDPTLIPRSDYEQKRSLLISSGDSPYIIPKTYPGSEVPFVSSGAILAISDYLDYMPNLKETIEKWEMNPTMDTLRQNNGKYYVLPGIHEVAWQDYTLAFRTDILDENGLEIPTSWDELYTVLKALKEAYPESIPFSDRWQGNSLLKIAAASYGVSGGWSYDNKTFDEKEGKFVYTGTTNEYKAMVEYFNKLIEEGLLDKESFTQDDQTALQKFYTGESFVISTNGQELITMEGNMDETIGKDKYSIAKSLTPEGEKGPYIAEHRLENGIMLSSKLKDSPNFKAILQFIDWLWYSEEGQVFAKWGIEGTTYELIDGKYTLTSDINFKGLNPDGTKDLQKDYGFSGGVYSYGGTKDLVRSTMNETEVAWLEQMDSEREELPLQPPAPLDDMQLEQATLISTPVKDYVDQSTLQFIVGQRDLSEWKAYVEEVDSKGGTQYIDMINDAYTKYQSENK